MQWIFAFTMAMLSALPLRAEGVVRVTTEGREYCASLAERLAAAPRAEAELPRGLGEEGRRLCATGHTRTGIAKLRRAIRAAQQAEALGSQGAMR